PRSRPISLEMAGSYDGPSGDVKLGPIEEADATVRPLREGIKITGLKGQAIAIEGGLTGDVAAFMQGVSDWTGLRAPEFTGAWKARFRGRRDDEVTRLAARLDLPAPTAPPLSPDGERLDLATSATLQVAHDASDDTLEVQDLKVWGDVASIDLTGTIEAPMGRRLADLQGTFELNEGPLQ